MKSVLDSVEPLTSTEWRKILRANSSRVGLTLSNAGGMMGNTYIRFSDSCPSDLMTGIRLATNATERIQFGKGDVPETAVWAMTDGVGVKVAVLEVTEVAQS